MPAPGIKYPYEFDQQKRLLARKYSRSKLLHGVVNGIFVELLALFLFLLFRWNAALKEFLAPLPTAAVVPAYAFLLITFINAVKFPMILYSSYVFDHRFGLSNYTLRAWFRDYFKRLFLDYVIGTAVLTGLFYLWGIENWWLIGGLLYTLLSVFLNYIYPVLIVPFFYRQEPYMNDAHKQRLLALCRMLGVNEIKDVVVVKESEKSKKPNAFFTGFGNTKKIALFDNLVNDFTEDEIETVIAHELAHYVNRDIWRGIAIDAVKIFPALFIIDSVMRGSVNYFGIAYFGDIAALPLFILLLSVLELAAMPLTNTYSRRREAQADLFALDVVKKPGAQISTEKRLADLSLGDDRPHPLIERIFHTHPATWRRIRMAEDWKKR